MKCLYIIYDAKCPLCQSIASRLRREPCYVPIVPIPSDAPNFSTKFPGLVLPAEPTEVLAIADTGDIYRGDAAWLICLWAMRRYRAASFTLADPLLRPALHRVVAFVGDHRYSISQLLRMNTPAELPEIACSDPNVCVQSLRAARSAPAESTSVATTET